MTIITRLAECVSINVKGKGTRNVFAGFTKQSPFYCIENNFFGEKITVSGLITATDIINQLKGKELGKELLIPISMLRHDENVFLDNLTTTDIEKALGVKVVVVENDGFDLLEKLLN